MGIQVTERMGINADNPIPVTMTMSAANEGGIPILGAMVVRFSGTDSRAMTHETRQIAYITNTSNRIVLSRAACIDLGMISETFPTIGEVIASDDAATPTHAHRAQRRRHSPRAYRCPLAKTISPTTSLRVII